jgi:hypothetical protein
MVGAMRVADMTRTAMSGARRSVGVAALVHAGIAQAQAADLAPRDLALLDRLTWGANASSVAHLQSLGAVAKPCRHGRPSRIADKLPTGTPTRNEENPCVSYQ